MNESIRVVFFDAADTLFHVNGSVAEIYLAHAVQFGFQQSPGSLDAVTQAFDRASRDAPPALFAETDPVKLKDSERLWWFDIVHNVFYRVGMFERFDDFFDEVFKAFENPDSWRLFPDTVPALQDLRSRNIELGIISNFDSRLFSVMRGLGIADLFDTITISSLAKAAKPAQKIFHLALEKHAVDPEEAIHIGDSIRDDVQGAAQAGLHAILLDRQGRKTDPQIRSIRSLKEIPEILER